MAYVNRITHLFNCDVLRYGEVGTQIKFHHYYVSKDIPIEDAFDDARKGFCIDTRFERGVRVNEIFMHMSGEGRTLMQRMVAHTLELELQRVWLRMRRNPSLAELDVCLSILEDMNLQGASYYDDFIDASLELISNG